MNTLMTQGEADINSALPGEALNEMRTLSSREIGEVSGGGPTLIALGGVLFIGMICLDYAEELTEASEKLAEWIRG